MAQTPHFPQPGTLHSAHSAHSAQSPQRKPRSHSFRLAALFTLGLTFGCGNQLNERLTKAYELQDSGQIVASIVELQSILKDEPENVEANFLLGTALVQTNRQMLAVTPLTLAATSEAYAIPAGLLLASTQYRNRNYQRAIYSSNRVLEIDPNNLTALFTRGQSHLASHQSEKALAHANQILAIKPQAQNAIIMKGTALVQLHRDAEAEAVWLNFRDRTAASDDNNTAARACSELGRFYERQRNVERADSVFVECLEFYPSHVYLQQAASEFYIQQGEPSRAIAIYRRGLELASDDIRAWNRLAAVLHNLGEIADAKTTLLEAVERFDTPDSWRRLANFYRTTRNVPGARQALEEALIRLERPAQAYLYSLADLLVEEGSLDRAKKIGERLNRPKYQHLLAGAISLNTGFAERALEELDQGLALWPNNANAHYLAGRAAIEISALRRAIVEFRGANSINDRETDASLRLAEIFFERGDFQLAGGLAMYHIARRPFLDSSPFHIAIRSALKLDAADEAAEILDSLRQQDPDSTAVIVELAAIKRATEGPQASIESIMASDRDLTDPTNEPILRALANELNALGRGKEGLRRVDVALSRDDTTAPLHDLRARILSQLGRNTEALVATDRALALDPKYVPALEMSAHLAIESGDLKKAFAALDRATDAAPINPSFPYRAATVADRLGDPIGRLSGLEESLARQPNYALAANDLAWILATDRIDLDRALVLAKIALRHSQSTNALTTLGWVRHQRGEFKEAIESYRAALEMDPMLPTLRYRLGLALAEDGRLDEAKNVFTELIQGPKFPELEAARDKLARISDSS